ncbi:MAG TPA: DinB family protein [candidate division Zixibacteria bacterium]|jgi:uncharacterized damage-inducible protein DinB
MTEIERIADQMRRAFEGGAWHGPSVTQVLEGIAPKQAAAAPITNGHSVWEIVLHMRTWIDVVHERIAGATVDVPDDRDWPAVSAVNASSWTRAQEELSIAHRALLDHVMSMTDMQLDQIPAGSKSTIYVQLHGAIQHNLYHAGQIAILRKAF